MIEITNLSKLKKAIAARQPFVIIRHYIHEEYTGQVREPNVIQTNGFYSVILGDPSHEVSNYNQGRGSWLAYGKAADWTFENGVCKLFDSKFNRPVWEIKFLER